MSYHIVKFHADGGQMCVPGSRCFNTSEDANIFAERLRNEPGHTCGPQSVKQYESEQAVPDEGVIYPGLANAGRNWVVINGHWHLC